MSDESHCGRIVTSAWADARSHTGKTRRDFHSNSTARWSKALVHYVDIVMEFVNEVFRCKWIGLRAQHLPASQEWPPRCPQFDVGVYETKSAQKRGTYFQKRVGFYYSAVRCRCWHRTCRRIILCHKSGWCPWSHPGESGTPDPACNAPQCTHVQVLTSNRN